MPLLMRDASLLRANALPNGAATVNGTSIDMKCVNGDFLSDLELRVEAPACTVGELADTQTITYNLQHSDDNASFVNISAALIVQTGAGGAGAAGQGVNVRPPLALKRFVRLQTVKTGASNASTKMGVLYPVF
jgi:hypothetical protein